MWGSNDYGQLGNNSSATVSRVPVAVVNISGVTAIAAGGSHTCALTTGGGVQCWGKNDYGQLGNNSTGTCSGYACSTSPIAVSGLSSGVGAIAAGGSHTCALTTGGGVQCSGYNTYGQLGNNDSSGMNSTIPVAVHF